MEQTLATAFARDAEETERFEINTTSVLFGTNANETISTLASTHSTGVRGRSVLYLVGFSILHTILWSTGIFGNVLVILSVAKFRKLRTRANSLIALLAVSDLWFNLGNVLSHVLSIYPDDTVCFIEALLHLPAFMYSVHFQIAISVNRYILVAKPRELYTRVFSKPVLIIISAIIFIADFIAFGVVPGKAADWKTLLIRSGYCMFHSKYFKTPVVMLSVTWVSFIVSFCCYFMLLRFVRNNSMTMATTKRRDAKASIALFVLLIYFVITFNVLPAFLSLIGDTIGRNKEWMEPLTSVIVAIQSTNMCLNPVVYSLRMKEFRVAFQTLLFCWKKKITPEVSTIDHTSSQ